jgi:hypothetical protein
MPSAAPTLSDLPGPVVEIRSARCDRLGPYARERLVEQFGPDFRVPDLLSRLAPDCPARSQMNNQACGAVYPALAEAMQDGSNSPPHGI